MDEDDLEAARANILLLRQMARDYMHGIALPRHARACEAGAAALELMLPSPWTQPPSDVPLPLALRR